MVEPGDDLAVVVGFLHRDVGHEAVWRSPVPVLFAWLDVDDVAGPDLLDAPGTGRDETDSVRDVERLTLGVVPGGAGARREADCAQPILDCSSGLRMLSM